MMKAGWIAIAKYCPELRDNSRTNRFGRHRILHNVTMENWRRWLKIKLESPAKTATKNSRRTREEPANVVRYTMQHYTRSTVNARQCKTYGTSRRVQLDFVNDFLSSVSCIWEWLLGRRGYFCIQLWRKTWWCNLEKDKTSLKIMS